MSTKDIKRLHHTIQVFKALGSWVMVGILERMIERDKKIVRLSYSNTDKDGGKQ